jgi:hypothetical protein
MVHCECQAVRVVVHSADGIGLADGTADAGVKRYTGIATSSQQQSQPRFRLIAPDVL